MHWERGRPEGLGQEKDKIRREQKKNEWLWWKGITEGREGREGQETT